MFGVRVGRVLTLGWALAGAVGALAGVLVAPATFVGPNQFDAVLVFGFAAAVVGGWTARPVRWSAGSWSGSPFPTSRGTWGPRSRCWARWRC